MSEYSGVRNTFEMTNEDNEQHENGERTYQGKKVKEHVDELVANSTLHGLHYCFDRQFWIRRICWSVLILIALAVVIQQFYLGADHYFKYPFFMVTTTKHARQFVFPAVTICNMNNFRYSAINGTWLNDYYMGAQPYNDSTFEKEYRKATQEATHQIKTMLKSCSMMNLPCSFKNFTQYPETSCFTFNSGSHGHPLITLDATEGLKRLDLVIDVEHDDYYQFTEEFGIGLFLHGQGDFPFAMQRILLSPGFSNHILLKRREVKNLPSPYATSCANLNLKYFKSYSKRHCYIERYTDALVSKCGCKNDWMPGEHRLCSWKDIKCMSNASTTIFVKGVVLALIIIITLYCRIRNSCRTKNNLKVFQGCTKTRSGRIESFNNEKDTCPLPCIEESYIPTVSMVRYPSNQKADQIAKSLNLMGTKTANRNWIRDHYLKVTVFFESFYYEDVEQVPAYNITMFMGDVGGILGLFLGASILTFIEFFDCIAMLLFSRFKLFKK